MPLFRPSPAKLLRLILIFLFLAPFLCRGDDYVLPPIVKDASPVDSLAQDPILPSQENPTGLSSGSGTIEQNLEDELPYSVTDPGRPGSLTQFRGLGRSADDTGVQALGIPLNPPQGGGFDFSTFPQFFWSRYQLSLAPSPSALDPRAAAGTISLLPWTAEALAEAGTPGTSGDANLSRSRWTALYAGSDLQQIAAGTTSGDRLAVLAGNSSGLMSGPSGSLSAKIAEGGSGDSSWSLKGHLLATDIAEQTYNFGFGQSPEQTTARILPILQLDAASQDFALKTSVFYDNEYIRYDDFSGDYFARDRAQQYGVENAFFLGDWKFGAGSRMVDYDITGFNAPAENVTNVMVSRTMSWGTGDDSELIASPVAQGVYVSGFSFAPQGSLGLREQWGDWGTGAPSSPGIALYSRWSYSRLFPTLADLFYSVPAVGGGDSIDANPALQPETDFTYLLGTEARSGIWSGSLEVYYQVRDDAQVLVLSAPGVEQQQNVGQARLASLVVSTQVALTKRLRISEAVNLTHSQVDALQSPYPYMPAVLNVLGVELDPIPRLSLTADTRAASNQYVDSSGGLPETAFADVQAAYEFASGLQLVGRVENVTGDDLVLEKDYAPKNRVLIVSLAGSL